MMHKVNDVLLKGQERATAPAGFFSVVLVAVLEQLDRNFQFLQVDRSVSPCLREDYHRVFAPLLRHYLSALRISREAVIIILQPERAK